MFADKAYPNAKAISKADHEKAPKDDTKPKSDDVKKPAAKKSTTKSKPPAKK